MRTLAKLALLASLLVTGACVESPDTATDDGERVDGDLPAPAPSALHNEPLSDVIDDDIGGVATAPAPDSIEHEPVGTEINGEIGTAPGPFPQGPLGDANHGGAVLSGPLGTANHGAPVPSGPLGTANHGPRATTATGIIDCRPLLVRPDNGGMVGGDVVGTAVLSADPTTTAPTPRPGHVIHDEPAITEMSMSQRAVQRLGMMQRLRRH